MNSCNQKYCRSYLQFKKSLKDYLKKNFVEKKTITIPLVNELTVVIRTNYRTYSNYQGRNMVYGLRAHSPKYDWDQGSEERAQGSEEWDQGSRGF